MASEDTGGLGATVHFGADWLGLITAYAKDIVALPLWEQRLWSAHNATPDGEVSRELFAARMEVKPASTKAPETGGPVALEQLDQAIAKRFGTPLLRDNHSVLALLRWAVPN